MDFSRKKSFKSNGSYKHRTNSGGEGSKSSPEELPILLDHDSSDHHHNHHQDQPVMTVVSTKTQNPDSFPHTADTSTTSNNKIWRESSYQFWEDKQPTDNVKSNVVGGCGSGNSGDQSGSFDFVQHGQQGTHHHHDHQDPPSKLINQFLNKQSNTTNNPTGEILLDMDMGMMDMDVELDELSRYTTSNSASREHLVSFDHPGSNSSADSADSTHNNNCTNNNNDTKTQRRNPEISRDVDVLRCTSNAAFQRKSTILSRIKTRSRLQDPSLEEEQRLSGWMGKSGQLRSDMITKAMEDDEDDPLDGEDVPDEYRRENLNAMTLIQWISLVIIVAALICSLSIHSLKERTLWNLHFWKWEVFMLVLICGRLVSGWGIRLVVFFLERNFILRKRVLYFVYGLRKAVQNCLWLGLVLLAWHFLFDKKVKRETNTKFLQYVTKILVCLLVGTLLWLVKTLVVKVLASSFHVSTYFDRIHESVFNQYIIVTLSGSPLIELQKCEEEEMRIQEEIGKLQNAGASIPSCLGAAAFPPRKSGKVTGNPHLNKSNKLKSFKSSPTMLKKADNGITIDHLHKLNHKNISAWNMNRLINIVRHGSLSTLDEQIQDNPHEDESTKQIKSENEAKAAARKIFQNVAQDGAKYIYMEDLLRFLRVDEALKTMSLFEGVTESKRISKSSLKNWLVNAFRERRALALTLNDTKTAVNKLHHMVNIIAAAIIIVIWLLILGIATSEFLIFVSSQLVLAAFIFGNTCKTVFESIIFLFIMHPYDVGDRCEIDDVQMVVEEMNILTTVFLRYDNLKIFYPNSVLWQKPVSNFYRSPDMGDAVEFCVHISTPAEKIVAMKQKILSYIDSKSEHWCPSPKIVYKEMEGLKRLRIAVWLSHRMNHQDMGERWARRSLLLEEMVKIFKELDMQFRLLPLDINVRAMPTSTRVPPDWTSTPGVQ